MGLGLPLTGVRSLNQVFFELGVAGTDGWSILSAVGISADGRTIVGEAFNPQGDIEAWRAVLPENAFAPEFVDVPSGVVSLDSFFSWTPTSDDVGDHVFTVRAYDNGVPSRFTDVQFTIIVTA